MFYWIYDIPSPKLALLLAVGFALISWLGTIFVRPILRLFVRRRHDVNDIVGYILSCFGVFYGLLLGLLAVASYQNFENVEGIVADEAASLSALVRDVTAYPEPERQNLLWLLRDYTRYVVKDAWPLQRRGIVPEGGNVRMVAFHERLLKFEPKTAGQEIIHAEALGQFNKYLEARRKRLFSVTTSIPAAMWYVVLVGAVMNIALVWLFDMRLVSHLFLGGLLSAFMGMMIFLIASLDNPFRGELSISSEPFQAILEQLMEEYLGETRSLR
ncbi:MAG: hypothetical protein ACOVNV_09700 [Pirellulaceae bacterium]